jgi:hypothetical protein
VHCEYHFLFTLHLHFVSTVICAPEATGNLIVPAAEWIIDTLFDRCALLPSDRGAAQEDRTELVRQLAAVTLMLHLLKDKPMKDLSNLKSFMTDPFVLCLHCQVQIQEGSVLNSSRCAFLDPETSL